MPNKRTSEDWVQQYALSHQHPVNALSHTIGIPLIVLSIPLFLAAIFIDTLWKIAMVMFIAGGVLQFIGHAFEGKRPEFFRDWRFLFIGVRWWLAKVRGKI